jgi:hypothetical protein
MVESISETRKTNEINYLKNMNQWWNQYQSGANKSEQNNNNPRPGG